MVTDDLDGVLRFPKQTTPVAVKLKLDYLSLSLRDCR